MRDALIATLIVLLAGCDGTPPAPPCETDADCREGSRCVEGRCAIELPDAALDAPANGTLIITIEESDAAIDAGPAED